MTDDEFKPIRLESPDAKFRAVSALHEAYARAWDEGIWVRELGGSPNGSFMTAAGSVYTLQRLEHDNPEIGEIDISELTIGDCVNISLPGSGPTREESVANAIKAFKESPLMEWHERMHAEAKENSDGD